MSCHIACHPLGVRLDYSARRGQEAYVSVLLNMNRQLLAFMMESKNMEGKPEDSRTSEFTNRF